MASNLANAAPYNTRSVKDVNYIVSIAGPASTATVNTSGMDLIQVTPYATTEYVIAQVYNSTSGNGANNRNVNCVLQDSADNSTWANIVTLANPIVQFIDNNGAGFAAASNYANVLLPPATRRYVRAQFVGETGGASSANATLVFNLLF